MVGPGASHLVLQLGDLPLAGRIVLQVVQHDLGVGQEGLGALQVLPQPLLRLDIPLADLEGGKEAGKGREVCIGCALARPWRTAPCKILKSNCPPREDGVMWGISLESVRKHKGAATTTLPS